MGGGGEVRAPRRERGVRKRGARADGCPLNIIYSAGRRALRFVAGAGIARSRSCASPRCTWPKPRPSAPNHLSPLRPPRYRLGLYQPPVGPLALGPDEEQEWVELRPRWPLTSEKAAGSTPPTRSSKAASSMARSLTDETRDALDALREAEAGGAGGAREAGAEAAVAAG